MTYLDYSATTPIRKEVLDIYNKVSLEYPGNSNSLHSLGVKSKELEDKCTKIISNLLKVKQNEIIYTSGASESNNTAIKGICFKYQNRGKHIITTYLEHSSIIAPLNYLSDLGFEVDFVNIKENGLVDVEHLKSLLRDDTILVSICAVDSEIGLVEPINEIANILKEYPELNPLDKEKLIVLKKYLTEERKKYEDIISVINRQLSDEEIDVVNKHIDEVLSSKPQNANPYEYYNDEAIKLLKQVSKDLGVDYIRSDQFVLAGAYAYLKQNGWNEDTESVDIRIKSFYYPSSHGSKSKIMTLCEKYIW